jgi:hypothetical protein
MFVIEGDGMLAAVLTPMEMERWFNTVSVVDLPGVTVWYVVPGTGQARRVTSEAL